MNNATDYNLDAMTAAWAVEIFEQATSRDDATDLAHEYADGSQWAMYYGKAHELCYNCNTDMGEQFLDDIGQTCDGMTYDKWASAIAYAEMYQRLERDLETLFEMQEEMA